MTPSGPHISVIRGMSCLIIGSLRGAASFPPGCPRGGAAATRGAAWAWGRGASGHPLEGRQGEDLGVVVGQGHLGEQGARLVVPGGVERPAEGGGDLPQLLADDLLDQGAGHLRALVEGDVVV